MTVNARFITADDDVDSAPLLFRSVRLDQGHGAVISARLRLSALGVVDAWINGNPVTQDLLTPGWTSYEWRIRAASHDVTGLLKDEFTIALAIGNGWYRGRLGWFGNSAIYGDERAGWAELRIDFEDGHEQTVGTDESWAATGSGILADDLYDGQTIDARIRPSLKDLGVGGPVRVIDVDPALLVDDAGPAIRRQEYRHPERIWQAPSGATLVDFGQNIGGWLKVRVQGLAGSAITVRYAEVLEDGELGVRPLRTAEATDRFILSGRLDEFEPTFTFHGFRYAEITGWPSGSPLTEDSLTAVVVHSDLRRIGYFKSSNQLLNRLHENIVWGLRGNFVGVPTDCPQRDERLGYTGDLAVFAPTAAFLYDTKSFLSEWLRDLALEQSHADGIVPVMVPNPLKHIEIPLPTPDATAIWSDAGVWVPWALWEAYGDEFELAQQFDSMAAHGRRVRSLLSPNGVWDAGFQFGDWLDPTSDPDEPLNSKADKGVVATACAYRTARMLADSARALAKTDEAAEFDAMASSLRSSFNQEYVDPADGRIRSDAPTAYALALAFGLLDDPSRQKAGDRLADIVEASGYLISTGFAGTPFITEALASTGHVAHAYRLLLQTDCPSWLYQVTMGATTVWERWDSMLPDGSINTGEMTSFNHYALGAVADWIHRAVGGLTPLEPGYARVLIAPTPGGDVTSAETTLDSPHGRISVSWQLQDASIALQVKLPNNVVGVVQIPGQVEKTLNGGSHALTVPFDSLVLD
ncbi:alpha-L-rhamnosidase [Arthrobacter sp. StoSoilB20]|uniref:alpha-L-rhamnosidase n=1 Tax=Arthrobacter sp. StoSoilB20 TaxID=2830995 RepID=UPI001CC38A2F|nr:alpha-L-rhamnosidase [Arthrobacter sp. StoSoilB20]BCW58648.1 alpha-L-rhamnosidase [Arthrobacter sp. StoSoilB20]